MELDLLDEDLSLWDIEWQTGDLISQLAENDWLHGKLSGLVGQDITDQGSSIATQVSEIKPGLDLSSEFCDSDKELLGYDDCSINDWMVEKMDFTLMDMVMNNSASSMFNLAELECYPEVMDASRFNQSALLDPATVLTPPDSPEALHKNHTITNNEFETQNFVMKCSDNVFLESHELKHTCLPENFPISPSSSSELSCSFDANNSISSFNSDCNNVDCEIVPSKNRSNRRKSAKLSKQKTTTILKKENFKGCKKDRKRSQNRNAATRYRIKKRAELDILEQQCEEEELRNKELKTKVSEISGEVKCLKELMKSLIESKLKKM